jgi:hypothetical protein
MGQFAKWSGINRHLKVLEKKNVGKLCTFLKLRRVPQFDKLMDMLDRGKTVWATTAWFMEQTDRGELSDCTFNTARTYINALKLRMEAIAAKVPRIDFSELRAAAVTATQQTRATAAILGEPEMAPGDIQQALTEEIERLDAVTALKYCFSIQKERVKELRQFEKKTGVPVPFGNKSMHVLGRFAAELGRLELGQAILRSRNAWAPVLDTTPRETKFSSEIERIIQLDPVDKNLIRDAREKLAALLEEECKSDQYSYRLEAGSGGTETKPSSGDN